MKGIVLAAENIDQYISAFPFEVQEQLNTVRATILNAAPDAWEMISYSMPTYNLDGPLVHFAAFAKHIGLYPGPQGIVESTNELAGYKTSKGAIQFPLDRPVPLDLITRIVTFRVKKNLEKNKKK